MHLADTLRGLLSCHAEVGFFTVVKKASGKDDGTVATDPRLVFDECVSHHYWKDPPCIALAGPGSLSSVDLVSASGGCSHPGAGFATGDILNYYCCLALPEEFAQWLVLPGITGQGLVEALGDRGQVTQASQLPQELQGAAGRVGLRVPVVG